MASDSALGRAYLGRTPTVPVDCLHLKTKETPARLDTNGTVRLSMSSNVFNLEGEKRRLIHVYSTEAMAAKEGSQSLWCKGPECTVSEHPDPAGGLNQSSRLASNANSVLSVMIILCRD